MATSRNHGKRDDLHAGESRRKRRQPPDRSSASDGGFGVFGVARWPRMTRRQRKRRAERQARQRKGEAASDGVLRLESLETRQLLAITANPRSVEDVAAEILPYSPGSVTQSIKHVTVVTHGFQPQLFGSGDSLLPLAEKIYARAGADRTWLLDYDVSN